MMAELDKTRLDMDRIRREMWWAPWIALSAIITGIAAVSGIIIALSHYIH